MATPVSMLPIIDGSCLPARVASMVWRGSEVGFVAADVVATGFTPLDAELPGGGWPRRSLTEILQPQPSLCEWRLLGHCLRSMVEGGGELMLVSPPHAPHLPGLEQYGLKAGKLVWLDARLPSERLWATEQLIKSNPQGAILAWLPQARSEQLRRLQVCAQSCEALVFLFRPAAAQFEASPAPLRILASLGNDWQLNIQVLKRRGPIQARPLSLFALSRSLASVLTPRQLRPAPLTTLSPEISHDISALGRSAGEPAPSRFAAH